MESFYSCDKNFDPFEESLVLSPEWMSVEKSAADCYVAEGYLLAGEGEESHKNTTRL